MNHQAHPAIPQLSGDLILDVFTHKSLRYSGVPASADTEFGDNERLAVLGTQLLATAVTLTLFHKRPMLSADDIHVSSV